MLLTGSGVQKSHVLWIWQAITEVNSLPMFWLLQNQCILCFLNVFFFKKKKKMFLYVFVGGLQVVAVSVLCLLDGLPVQK